MMEQLKTAYRRNWWVKIIALIGLLFGGVILFLLSGGMPPWAWRFSVLVLTQLSHLWAASGAAILFPLFALGLLSIALFILWCLVIIFAIKIVLHLREDFLGRDSSTYPSFEEDLQEAELLAAEAVSRGTMQEETEQFRAAPLSAQQNYAIMGNLRAMGGSHAYNENLTQTAPGAARSSARSIPSRPQRRVSIPLAPSLEQSRGGETARQQRVPTQGPPPPPFSFAARQQLRLVPPPLEEELYEQERQPVAKNDTFASPAVWSEAPKRLQSTIWYEEEEDIDKRNTVPVSVEGLEEEEDIDELDTIPRQYDEYDTIISKEEEVSTREAPLRLMVSIGLDPGIARKNDPNEDSLFAIQGVRITDDGPAPAGLFVVADGMGGHANGREASRQAVRTISDIIVPALLRDVSGNTADEEHIFLDMLKEGAHRANLAVYQRNRGLPDMMGTTLTCALIVNSTAYVVNVGDSRTYLYRPTDGLIQITRDHSIVARLVENGNITRDEIYTHPQRNQIYRCLGEHASVEMDAFVVPLEADDILLLCSDGLWEMVRDGAIEKIVAASAHNPAHISTILVQAALSCGGADNISIVIVGITRAEE